MIIALISGWKETLIPADGTSEPATVLLRGLGLPDDVLQKIYHGNAAKLLPVIKQKLSKYQQNKTSIP